MTPDNLSVAGIDNLKKIAQRFRVSRCWRCRSKMKKVKFGTTCPKCGVRKGKVSVS